MCKNAEPKAVLNCFVVHQKSGRRRRYTSKCIFKTLDCKKEFNSDEHMAKWLTKVCINESKDLLRLHFRKRNVPLEEAINLSNIDNTQDIDLIKAVMSLPKNQRTVIHLFYFEDLQINEIAKLLNIKESAVKTRLSRARQKLKVKLGDDDYEK